MRLNGKEMQLSKLVRVESLIRQPMAHWLQKKAAASGNLCRGKCPPKCSEVSEETNDAVHIQYYKLNLNAVNSYMFGLTDTCKPKRTVTNAEQPRGWSFAYHVILHGQRPRARKTAICQLHSIGRSRLKYISYQVSAGQHAAEPDRTQQSTT